MRRFQARITRIAVAALLCATFSRPAIGQDLTYEPINPSFGGDPLNSRHLRGLAETQKQPEADSSRGFSRRSQQQRFADSLERRLLSRASQEIVNRIFGEDGDTSGTFSLGSQQIDFQQIGDQVEITLTDAETGATTQLSIPTPTP